MDLHIRTWPPVRLAYMRYNGPYGSPIIAMEWKRFGEWCEKEGLSTPRRKMYGISLDNPMVKPPLECRYDIGIEVDQKFTVTKEAAGAGVALQEFAGGCYACVPFVGTAAQISLAWMSMFAHTLPQSGLERADAPPIEVYLEDFKVDPATWAFNCLLCVAVKGEY